MSEITRQEVYRANDLSLLVEGYRPKAEEIPWGTAVDDVYFDGYPQLIKSEMPQPTYKLLSEKDIPVTMRDGIRLYTDIYRPDAEGERFPALLAYAYWAKDVNAAIDYLADQPQPYLKSPFWNGNMEACDFNYTVPRGFAHIIPDPRGIGNSEGYGTKPWFNTEDVYDMVEWIAAQPWCNGKVGMIGPSAYSIIQIHAAVAKPPHLTALRVDECGCGTWDYFNGVLDIMAPFSIETGRHCNDGAAFVPNYEYTPIAPRMLSALDIEERLAEAKEYPDFKYNTKFLSYLLYPRKYPLFFDMMLEFLHPYPEAESHAFTNEKNADKIDLPIYLGTPWNQRLYNFFTFDVWDAVSTPVDQKKLIVYPPGITDRPYVEYHDELLRWNEYWLKGVDNGIMDEPPIKLFVQGVNKWRFEREWPLKRTEWQSWYLQPGGGLAPFRPVAAAPDILDQQAPYIDPTPFCLRYKTAPFEKDMEITGPVAFNLFAAIDADDTNWFVDLVDLDENGNRQWISFGALKAGHRALASEKSTPYRPVHPWTEPVPVPVGEVTEYNIAMIPMSCVFKKNHSIELIVRNQDDLKGDIARSGVYYLPFMRAVKHWIHFGKSHLLLPVIP